MNELAFYFSNADSLDADVCASESQSSVLKEGRKFTRPISLYLPSHLESDLSSPPDHVGRDLELCECCFNEARSDGCRRCATRFQNSGSYVSLLFSEQLPPEVESGNVEYKRKLVNPTPNRFEHLVTQMKWRLNEGGGEAIYRLGVEDDGHVGGLAPGELASSLATLERMAKRLNATVHLLQERTVDSDVVSSNAQSFGAPPVAKGQQSRKALELLVRQAPLTNHGRPNICLAVLGGMDVGKSTLIGVLTDGELDNARGRARLNLFRHLHEVQSGRTSCLSSELLGFDAGGNVTNYTRSDGLLSRSSVDELVRNSYQLITLLDSAGHSKYQRTTVAGLARAQPVGVLLLVSATAGLTSTGLEHAQLAFSLRLPLAVIVSKIDQLGNGAERTSQLVTLYRQISTKLQQLESDIRQSFDRESQNIAQFHPLFFPVSAVTGEGIDELIHFLSGLGRSVCIDTALSAPPSSLSTSYGVAPTDVDKQSICCTVDSESMCSYDKDQSFVQTVDQLLLSTTARSRSVFTRFCVCEVFTSVAGVPDPVLFGTAQFGRLVCGDLAWLGPDQFGEFHLIQIVSLHHNRQPYSVIYAGQTASVAVRFLANTISHATKCSPIQEDVFVMDNDENKPDGAGSCFSISHHRRSPPFELRRGIVLLSNSVWSNNHVGSLFSSPNLNLFQLPMLVGTGASVGVAWSLDIQVIHRLSIFPGISVSSTVFIPPLPSIKQRVTLYAGCVAQSAVVTAEVSSDHPANVPLLQFRFTRRPEYMEVGQQLILTWGSCAKAVGLVTTLRDLVPSGPDMKLRSYWIDSEACIRGERFVSISTEPVSSQDVTQSDCFQSSRQLYCTPPISPDLAPSSSNTDSHFVTLHARRSTDASASERSSYETAIDFPTTEPLPSDNAHCRISIPVTVNEHATRSKSLIITPPNAPSNTNTLSMDESISEKLNVPPPPSLRRPPHRRPRRRRKHR